jgi:hypothetical protein
MKKQVIRLTESDLNKLIQESVNTILSELDWRTYDSARNKALDDIDGKDIFTQERRKNQASEFQRARNKAYSKQYNLKRFDDGQYDKSNFKPTQGELKQASKRQKDAYDFNSGKSAYQSGKGWHVPSDYESFTMESCNESIDVNYTHFAVNKGTNKIVNGWDYNDIDSSELKSFANDYFWDEIKDMGLNPKDFKILTKKSCIKQGIDPNDEVNSWENISIE